ncbi:MAG: zinc-binding dehydrogenase [Saprospiraceae bacterium]|nr:zinc-binding dehydrogenase [Saprospiraceae bacterium]
MKALTLQDSESHLIITDKEISAEHTEREIVKLAYAALNHRDVWMTKGMYPGLRYGTTLGSCGAGYLNERKVLINPNINWGEDPDYPDHNNYSILGMPIDGTMAEYISIPKDRVHDIPGHLKLEEAAALPLAGLTAYRALFSKAQLKEDDKVLISGIGGGVALMAFQFAIAIGAEVYVTSSQQSKIDEAIKLGATGGANYTEENWHKSFVKEHGPVDVVIDSAGGEGYNNLLKTCAPLARVVNYGGTRGNAVFSPQLLFWKELQLLGSTMGNDDEFVQMLEFVSEFEIHPVVDEIFAFDDYKSAFEKMDASRQFGKILLSINP